MEKIKNFINEHKVEIGVAVVSVAVGMIFSKWAKYVVGCEVDIKGNHRLVITEHYRLGGKKYILFSGKDTHEIVDKLMDQYYPGD